MQFVYRLIDDMGHIPLFLSKRLQQRALHRLFIPSRYSIGLERISDWSKLHSSNTARSHSERGATAKQNLS
jgi:hypothetical protein